MNSFQGKKIALHHFSLIFIVHLFLHYRLGNSISLVNSHSCNIEVTRTYCQCFQSKNNIQEMSIMCQGLPNAKKFNELTKYLAERQVSNNHVNKEVPVVTSLQLTNSSITSLTRDDLLNVGPFKMLNLSHNLLSDVQSAALIYLAPILEYLDLSFNNLTHIREWFEEPGVLVNLRLSNNKIQWILPNALNQLTFLKFLDLSQNSFKMISESHFANLSSLEELSLSHNQISTIQDRAFEDLFSLVKLHLSHNLIMELDSNIFSTNILMVDLFLEHNSLITLPSTLFQSNTRLQKVHLLNNPWKCDKNLYWLYFKIQTQNSEIATSKSIFCHSPAEMQNKTWLQWMNIIAMETSFKNCSTCSYCDCYVDLSKNVAVLNCSSRKLTSFPVYLPFKTGRVHLEDNLIQEVVINASHHQNWKDVRYLHLDGNQINSIRSVEINWITKNLSALHLTRNRLQDISIHLLDQLRFDLFLADNPWTCDCNTVLFKKWLLRHHRNVKDIENVRCHGKDGDPNAGRVISQIMKSELCPQPDLGLNYLDVLNVVMAFLIVLICSKLLFDYWWQKRTGKLPHFFKLRTG